MLEGSKKSYYMYMVMFLHSFVGIHDLNNFFCQLYVVKLKYLGGLCHSPEVSSSHRLYSQVLVTSSPPLNDEKFRNIEWKEEFQLQMFFFFQVMFENSVINPTMLDIIQVLKTILFKFYKRRKKWGVVWLCILIQSEKVASLQSPCKCFPFCIFQLLR